MSKFESKVVRVEGGAQGIFEFLSNAEDLYELMPKERIEDWKADKDSCSFRVSGLSSMDLERSESVPSERVDYQGGDQAPFPFVLSFNMKETEGSTDVQVTVEAEMNYFMEQMAHDPLKRLCDHMADRLKELAPGNGAP